MKLYYTDSSYYAAPFADSMICCDSTKYKMVCFFVTLIESIFSVYPFLFLFFYVFCNNHLFLLPYVNTITDYACCLIDNSMYLSQQGTRSLLQRDLDPLPTVKHT